VPVAELAKEIGVTERTFKTLGIPLMRIGGCLYGSRRKRGEVLAERLNAAPSMPSTAKRSGSPSSWSWRGARYAIVDELFDRGLSTPIGSGVARSWFCSMIKSGKMRR
jgi:hypothetical protein